MLMWIMVLFIVSVIMSLGILVWLWMVVMLDCLGGGKVKVRFVVIGELVLLWVCVSRVLLLLRIIIE